MKKFKGQESSISQSLNSQQQRIEEGAKTRLLLSVCLKLLGEAQWAVADDRWCERNMDVKINRILCPQYFKKTNKKIPKKNKKDTTDVFIAKW